VTPSATRQEGVPDLQLTHSNRPGCAQPVGRCSVGHPPDPEVPVLTVAVLVVFFALLTVADVLPGQSGAPGLVAPVR
jgi:hypothetical protein